MPRIRWPDDHPNTKNLMFVDSSRQVIARVPPSPLRASTTKILDQIEHLIDDMTTDKSREQLFALVGQVGPLMKEAIARMDLLRAQIQH